MIVGKKWINVVMVALGDKVHGFQSEMDINLMDFGLPSKLSHWKIFVLQLQYITAVSVFSQLLFLQFLVTVPVLRAFHLLLLSLQEAGHAFCSSSSQSFLI